MNESQEAIRVEGMSRANLDDANLSFGFDLLNSTDTEVRFRAIRASWRYLPGFQESIGLGDILRAAQSYVIDLELDVDSWNDRTEPLEVDTELLPRLILPPRNSRGYGSCRLDLHLHYSFVGRIDWHPQSDWNIEFSLALVDDSGLKVELVNGALWREDLSDVYREHNEAINYLLNRDHSTTSPPES